MTNNAQSENKDGANETYNPMGKPLTAQELAQGMSGHMPGDVVQSRDEHPDGSALNLPTQLRNNLTGSTKGD